MLKVKSATKSFEQIKAVDNCSLEVNAGDITGLIGPNGAGKTTLFNLITGFCSLDQGEILFKEERIDSLPPYLISRKKISRTFQLTREITEMNLIENLLSSVPGPDSQLKKKALQILNFLQLEQLKHERARNLSSGQKKLLELGRALMGEPELILLDEPGAGVNPTLLNQLAEHIQDLNQEGITFFLIEHDMDVVMNLCNPIIVMANGRKLAQGSPQEVKENKEVLRAYLGGLSPDGT